MLMQLQRTLADLPGIIDAGVVMGTPANKELLRQSDLLVEGIKTAVTDDLIIVVRAADTTSAQAALAQVDELLTRRRAQAATTYRPKSLDTAARMLPDGHWVLVSVPGRYAAGVAHHALALGKNVFLYSNNVALEDEVDLKMQAAQKGLLVMGPDCGTAIVNGIGLGFANRVRRGAIGLVAASGTGLQLVTACIHQLGGGVSHALGTGGRDLSDAVGAIAARQSLALLARDPETAVIVLISKPPSPAVAEVLLHAVRTSDKPVVVNFIGYETSAVAEGVTFARTLDETAELAVRLVNADPAQKGAGRTVLQPKEISPLTSSQKYLRGLFAGGTLAYETLLLLQGMLPEVYSNAPLKHGPKLANAHRSQGHTIVDLGADEFTVGRLHPMLDNDLRIRRLQEEAEDPETAVILFDVVLGDGAHPDPAAALVPAITRANATASAAGRSLVFIAVVVGTDEDPQDMASQIERLQGAGVHVFTRNDEAVRAAGGIVAHGRQGAGSRTKDEPGTARPEMDDLSFAARRLHLLPVDPAAIQAPLAAINAGLESFAQSLIDQGASVVHVDWRPPAGGNERLVGLLARMKKKE